MKIRIRREGGILPLRQLHAAGNTEVDLSKLPLELRNRFDDLILRSPKPLTDEVSDNLHSADTQQSILEFVEEDFDNIVVDDAEARPEVLDLIDELIEQAEESRRLSVENQRESDLRFEANEEVDDSTCNERKE